MLQNVVEAIEQWIHEMLEGFVLSNMETMYSDVNEKVGTIAAEVGKSPQSWNGAVFDLIRNLSDSVMMPIAGVIITYVLCYELITMIIDKNTMHDIDTWMCFKFVFKAAVAVYLVSHTMDITLAIFELGKHAAASASGVITKTADVDVKELTEKMSEMMKDMPIGELFTLVIETAFISLTMKLISIVITVTLYIRMVEIFLYISVAPIPFATLSNREWGHVGNNYIRGLLAMAFQAFFIMVCVGIYAILVANIHSSENIHSAVFSLAAYAVLLCMSLMRMDHFSRSIFGAH